MNRKMLYVEQRVSELEDTVAILVTLLQQSLDLQEEVCRQELAELQQRKQTQNIDD